MGRFIKTAVTLFVAVSMFAATKTKPNIFNPPPNHVVIVMEENHGFSSAMSGMPWLAALAKQYSYLQYSYGDVHPSIGNYFNQTTGQTITTSDGYTGTVTADNIARQLTNAGLTWKAYAESLPYDCYTGGDSGAYAKHHVPFVYFSDVKTGGQACNVVRFEDHFAQDLASGNLPQYSFVVPNMNDNAHNGTLSEADNWLKSHIAPLLTDPNFSQDGVLIVTFDEAATSDTTHGGGKILTVIAGANVKPGYVGTHNYYQQQSVLRTVETMFSLPYIQKAARTTDFSEVFGSTTTPPPPPPPPPPTPTPVVVINSPAAGATVPTTFDVNAQFNHQPPTAYMKVWVDGVAKYVVDNTENINIQLTLPVGTHKLTVQGNDGTTTYSTAETITVQ